MDQLFTNLNIEQLTTSGGFIAFLLWLLWKRDKKIEDQERVIEKWQDRYISQLAEAQRDALEASRTFERVLDALQRSV